MVNARGDAMAVAACRGKMGAAEARRAMAGCALTGAVVSTDRQRSYVRALAEMGAAARRGLVKVRLREWRLFVSANGGMRLRDWLFLH